MSRNIALVTGAAQAQAASDLDDYAAGVAAHLGGDWSGHRQVNVVNSSYVSGGSGILADYVARFQLTDDTGVTRVVSAPAFFVQSVTPSDVPLIVVQPLSVTASSGQTAMFRVFAASAVDMAYQWQFKASGSTSWISITGATDSVLVLAQAVDANEGGYRVVVSNAAGSTTSTTATLTVS